MKKICLYMVVCIFLVVPVAKVLDYSVSAYQRITDEMFLLQNMVDHYDLTDQHIDNNSLEESERLAAQISKSLESLIVMYNRIVFLLATALLVVIGIAIWKSKL